MRVLVTGSAGQLGRLVLEVLSLRHEVVGLDVLPAGPASRVGSVADRALVAELVRGVDAVVHTASLHAPHVPTHPKQAFVDTNVTGTLCLLEACAAAGVSRFVYSSTTSLYGAAMEPKDRAVFVTEALTPRPRDIYDVTKLAAEELCRLFAAERGARAISLRVSRFFDEGPELAARYRMYRGVDARDAAAAHELALTCGGAGFSVYNVSARPPFREEDAAELLYDAAAVIRRRLPGAEAAFRRRGFGLPSSIDRVYVIAAAERELGYTPRHNYDSLWGASPPPAGAGDPAP